VFAAGACAAALAAVSVTGGWLTAARMTRRGTPSAGIVPGGQPADLVLHRAKIDRATGMLTGQLGTGIAGGIHAIAGLRFR
jgi:hypothetical protein